MTTYNLEKVLVVSELRKFLGVFGLRNILSCMDLESF